MAETRKLAAILAADVVGYSRLAGADEEGTVARIRALRSEGGVRGCKLGLKLRKHQDNTDRDHQRDRNLSCSRVTKKKVARDRQSPECDCWARSRGTLV